MRSFFNVLVDPGSNRMRIWGSGGHPGKFHVGNYDTKTR